jgi:hypothetical protein
VKDRGALMKSIRVKLTFRIFNQERGEVLHGGAGQVFIQRRHGLLEEGLFLRAAVKKAESKEACNGKRHKGYEKKLSHNLFN